MRRLSRIARASLLGFTLLCFILLVVLFILSYGYGRGDFIERHGSLRSVVVDSSSHDSLYIVEYKTLTSTSGLTVEVGMLTPRAISGPVPVFILLGGKATGKNAIQYVFDVEGAVIVAVDYAYDPRPTYTIGTFFEDLPSVRRALLDMVPSVSLVADHLHGLPSVDTNRVIMVGYSFGAPFVPVTSTLDRRIDCAVMVYGGGDIRGLITHNVARYEGWLFSNLVGTLGGLLLRPIEPMRFIGEVAPTPLVMVNGTDDEQVPRRHTTELYDGAKEPKSIRWIESRHVHPRNVELTRSIIGVLKEELRKLEML